ncbi:MAG: hypothetical protein ACSLE2_05785 [Lysobacterales bacterium]
MIYVLHHSKGILMLSAEDRAQVIRWSERQLGNRAGTVFITEGTLTDEGPSVEKDGTGIKARQADGCFPVLRIIASTAQDVLGEQGCSGCDEDARLNSRMNMKEPTWH